MTLKHKKTLLVIISTCFLLAACFWSWSVAARRIDKLAEIDRIVDDSLAQTEGIVIFDAIDKLLLIARRDDDNGRRRALEGMCTIASRLENGWPGLRPTSGSTPDQVGRLLLNDIYENVATLALNSHNAPDCVSAFYRLRPKAGKPELIDAWEDCRKRFGL